MRFWDDCTGNLYSILQHLIFSLSLTSTRSTYLHNKMDHSFDLHAIKVSWNIHAYRIKSYHNKILKIYVSIMQSYCKLYELYLLLVIT